MGSKFAALLLAVLVCEASAAPTLAGQWFSCAGNSGEFESLAVERAGDQYTGLLESSRSGGAYSAELKGSPRSGVLKLSGCQAYRGELSPVCVAVAVTLGKRASPFKRISPQDLERNIADCRAKYRDS